MKYASIDLETTGLDTHRSQVLQIGCVIEDTDPRTADVKAALPLGAVDTLPTFEALVHYDRLDFEPFALVMNAGLVKRILELRDKPDPAGPMVYLGDGGNGPDVGETHWRALEAFLEAHLGQSERKGWVVAGKNIAGFDLKFFPSWLRARISHRVIDAGSVALGAQRHLWAGPKVPGLNDLWTGPALRHDAVDDARAVVTLLRQLSGDYGKRCV